MHLLLTILVFAAVAGFTCYLGLRPASTRERALSRLSPSQPPIPRAIPRPADIWRELIAIIGTHIPASPKNASRTRKRLVRAGFRGPSAVRTLNGTRVVTTAVLGLVALAVAWRLDPTPDRFLVMVGGGVLAGYSAPMQYLQFRVRRRQHRIERGLPNALDLMVVCVESGLGLDQTIIQVAKELQVAFPDICDELSVVNLEMRAGKRRAEALRNLADRTGVEDVRKLVAVLIQTDRFGTSIAQSLRGHSDYLRVMARQRAEERAAKLAVKLVFPIFFCVLPSLFVVTIAPVLTRLVRDLFPMIENM